MLGHPDMRRREHLSGNGDLRRLHLPRWTDLLRCVDLFGWDHLRGDSDLPRCDDLPRSSNMLWDSDLQRWADLSGAPYFAGVSDMRGVDNLCARADL